MSWLSRGMRQPKSQVLPTIVARPTFPSENKMVARSGAGNETNLDQALVQWQNMATRECKNTKITKSQNPWNIHPVKIKESLYVVLVQDK